MIKATDLKIEYLTGNPTIDIVSLKELIAFDIIVGSTDFVINFVKIGITDLIIS